MQTILPTKAEYVVEIMGEGDAATYIVVPVSTLSQTLTLLHTPSPLKPKYVVEIMVEGKRCHLCSSDTLHPQPDSHPPPSTFLPSTLKPTPSHTHPPQKKTLGMSGRPGRPETL